MLLTVLFIFSLALLAGTLPALGYLGTLALLSRRPRLAEGHIDSQRFVFVVPAHNESAGIGETIASLQAVDYPQANRTIVVVADNCSDDTAQVARAAGARVLVRQHDTERGKGYALHYAFDMILQEDAADAVVVIDADSVVSANFLHAFAARLVDGELAMQAEYGVRNPYASWRTRLMAVALGMFHRVRGIARERLRLSAGLRGNGMCFALACLKRFPHQAYGLVEDVEYGISLGMGGVRVAYADEARVAGEMVSTGQASESQRARWEHGRKALIREALPKLLRAAWRRRSLLLLDLAIDLAVPPLGRLAVLLLMGTVVEVARYVLASAGNGAMGGPALSWAWAAAWACLAGYVGRGMVLSHLGMGAVWAMLFAPVYVVWKLLLKVRGKSNTQQWVRTAREKAGPPP